MKLPTFNEYHTLIKKVEKCLSENDGTIEGFFEALEKEDVDVSAVMTNDIASMTLPLGTMKRRYPLEEVAPDDPEAEKFIRKLKPEFKKRYGDNWAKVLYALAWKRYGHK